MPDYFALLEQPRRPWIEEAALRDAFHRLAAVAHPDAGTGTTAAFTDLNTAYATLRDPGKRLRHWLELESPAALHQPAPIAPDLGELFPQIAAARQALLELSARRRSATTALSRALLADDEARVRTIADSARTALNMAWAAAETALRSLGSDSPSPGALAELYRRFAYLSKWDEQLREAAVQVEIG